MFTKFLDYVTEKQSLRDIADNSHRTLQQGFKPFWDMQLPPAAQTGEIHPYIQIDGTYLDYGWMLLVARSKDHVLAWQWAGHESSAAYEALFAQLIHPDAVITDGAAGALKAINRAWPGIPIQRCLVHVHRNNVADLTHHPQTDAGQALLALSQKLLQIEDISQAIEWQFLLHDFAKIHKDYLRERTYAKDDPDHARGRTWWYTHERDRRVWKRLEKLLAAQQLFTFLTHNIPPPHH